MKNIYSGLYVENGNQGIGKEHVCSAGSLSWPLENIHKGAPWPLSLLSCEGTEHFFPAIFDTHTLLITFSTI